MVKHRTKHASKGCRKVTGYRMKGGRIVKVKVHTKKSCLVKKHRK